MTASAPTTTPNCAASSIRSASTTSSSPPPSATARVLRFDATLLRVLERYDAVMAVMLPSLRAERSASYSPFLPLHPVTGHVMQVPIDEVKVSSGTIVWRDPATGESYETPVTGGHAKLQWKPDWAMRWVALGVDYEMAGKDLIDSVKLSGQIARAPRRRAARGLQLRALPRREGPEDLEVEGQRAHHRRVAGLRHAREPRAVHVQQAAGGQAPAFRRHPRVTSTITCPSWRSSRARSRS